MSDCEYIVQVYFGKRNGERDVGFQYDRDTEKLFGTQIPLWKPHGRPVLRWAVDYITCSDERWVVVGPYASSDDAHVVALSLLRDYNIVPVSGVVVHAEHCFRLKCMKQHGEVRILRDATGRVQTRLVDGNDAEAFPFDIWTDG